MNAPTRKPYDIFVAMERLRNDFENLSTEQRNLYKTAIALTASDPEAVSVYVDIDGDDWANIYPDLPKPQRITTNQAIDRFIENYGNSSPGEEQLLERLIFNPVPADYSSVLAAQEAQRAAAQQQTAGAVPQYGNPAYPPHPAQPVYPPQPAYPPQHTYPQHTYPQPGTYIPQPGYPQPGTYPPPPAPHPYAPPQGYGAPTAYPPVYPSAPAPEPSVQPANPDMTPANGSKGALQGDLTLELAKIFVKQGQFRRAKDIISKIILNNPEKSVYFADQLRFIDKAIMISEHQSKNN